MLTYEEAKAQVERFDRAHKEASDKLRAVPGLNSGPMGLTPENVRNSAEFKEAKSAYDWALSNLQTVNKEFLRRFAKEIREERRQRSE